VYDILRERKSGSAVYSTKVHTLLKESGSSTVLLKLALSNGQQ
jgi:hypothetical protein